MKSRKPVLGFFQLVMINVIAVDSIRTLPFSAVYGFSLVFFYLLAALVFFIPAALVSAELGTGWPNRGGIYVWVREAFGKKVSFLVIWLNWIYNVFWFPTILALIAGTFTYFFNPEWAQNTTYMAIAVVVLFWIATLVNMFGMRASSFLSTLGAIVGTIFPMVLIAGMGVLWIIQGNQVQVALTWDMIIPHGADFDNLAFLTSIFFGLLGLEMTATHAQEMRNPSRDYPRSIFTSIWIILGTTILASLAIAIVVPNRELSLATGIMQAFTIFFNTYHIPWGAPFIAGCIVLGGLSGVGAWIIGPTKGLQVASQDGSIPSIFAKMNRFHAPIGILWTQAIIVSLLSLVYILFPSVNKSFWILSIITAQLALLVYIILFATAIKLSYEKPDVPRLFKVPGKKVGIWVVCGFGAISSTAVFLLGFLPSEQIPVKNIFLYELILIGGIASGCLVPLWIYRGRKKAGGIPRQ